MSKYIVIGAGGLARELSDYIEKDKIYGFLADKKPTEEFLKDKYLGRVKLMKKYKDFEFILAIANQKSKKNVLNLINSQKIKIKYANIIHHTSFISSEIKLGKGNIIAPQTYISYGCSIGNFNVINFSSFLGHNTKIGNYNHLAPKSSIMGNCEIGNYNYIGANSILESEIKVGSNNSILSGSKCLNNIKNNSLVFNNPARIISNKTTQKV